MQTIVFIFTCEYSPKYVNPHAVAKITIPSVFIAIYNVMSLYDFFELCGKNVKEIAHIYDISKGYVFAFGKCDFSTNL